MKCLPPKQVVIECPFLHGHETAVDKVLSECLIEAKHYITQKPSENNSTIYLDLGL